MPEASFANLSEVQEPNNGNLKRQNLLKLRGQSKVGGGEDEKDLMVNWEAGRYYVMSFSQALGSMVLCGAERAEV